MLNHTVKRRLLVIDDEQDITLTLSTVLRESGFEVVSFNDPLLALRSFRPRYYDLVILDIRMPHMNGFELYREIRRKGNGVKVCFLTAVNEFREYEQYRHEAYPKLGERHFIRTSAVILFIDQWEGERTKSGFMQIMW